MERYTKSCTTELCGPKAYSGSLSDYKSDNNNAHNTPIISWSHPEFKLNDDKKKPSSRKDFFYTKVPNLESNKRLESAKGGIKNPTSVFKLESSNILQTSQWFEKELGLDDGFIKRSLESINGKANKNSISEKCKVD